jgi:hypothetical protein
MLESHRSRAIDTDVLPSRAIWASGLPLSEPFRVTVGRRPLLFVRDTRPVALMDEKPAASA